MRKLSTGDDLTLKSFRKLTVLVFGSESQAVVYLDKKIVESPNGENEEVLTDERQMIQLLHSMHEGGVR